MPALFHPSSNTVARATIFGGVLVFAGLVWSLVAFGRSSYVTQVAVARQQPIPFSHQHHVEGLGIDCRYCHTSVEDSSFAGIPSTKVCMTCHSQIWADAPMLRPVHESYNTGKPIEWARVHDLPDFVYFNHGIHVSKGVACVSCHGRVDKMPLMWRDQALHMRWCLECHREPERFVRPREEVFSMTSELPPDHVERGRRLVEQYGVKKEQLTNCSICHR